MQLSPPRAGVRATASPRHRSRLIAALVGLVILLLAGAARYVQYLGYPAGPVVTVVSAHASPRADRGRMVAVFLSGGMGFHTGMAPRIAEDLARQGIAVVEVNSMAAFAARQTPAEAGALIARAAARALALPGAERLVLIGQSFGADALLAGEGGLPPAVRSRVAMVALIVPGDTYALRVRPSRLFGRDAEGAALPLARHLGWAPVLCIHGNVERNSLCPQWRQANVTDAELPGSHSLQHDTALISATVLHALDTVGRGRATS